MSICLGPRATTPAAPRAAEHGAAGRGARFNHVKCAPTSALAPFVEHYWVTRWDRRGHPARTAASLLDPCVHLQVREGRAEVMGVVRGTFETRIEGVGCVVGVRFRPGGFHPFVRRPVSLWTDRVEPAQEALGGTPDVAAWASDLSERVLRCDGDAAAHAALVTPILDAFLGALLPARDASAERVAELVRLIAASADVRRVRDLARASGSSERTLDRLFARYVGVSPAWVIRRYRLRAATERLSAPSPADASVVAWETGYADQAHLIRDFRATIGVTPGAYVQGRA